MYKFIVDAQLPPALARFLSSLGEDVIHVFDVDMMEASDTKIWDLALRETRVIITKDEFPDARICNRAITTINLGTFGQHLKTSIA
ncbi:MAG: hypothetical protein COB26_03925 [Piscirickettsiaceae bacterium]|nr:MAG: hypothetical protein COB26_03925 [Piscirickettsiaceae bacterium]